MDSVGKELNANGPFSSYKKGEDEEECKECRAEAIMKTEDRKKEGAGLMESLESRTVRGRDKERETHRKLYFQIMHSLNVHMWVFNAYFYTSPFED